MTRKKNTGIRYNEPSTNLGAQNTMANSSRKQQHRCFSNNSSIVLGMGVLRVYQRLADVYA